MIKLENDFTTIWVKKDTREYIKQLKVNKKFHSLDEVIITCLKVCAGMTKGQLIRLAEEVKVKTAPNETEMLRQELTSDLKEPSIPFEQVGKISSKLFEEVDEE